MCTVFTAYTTSTDSGAMPCSAKSRSMSRRENSAGSSGKRARSVRSARRRKVGTISVKTYFPTRARRASRASRSPTASAAEPEPPPISRITAGLRRRQGADHGFRAQAIVDLVEEVVVREVVEPQGQSRGRKEDLLARLLAGEKRRDVLDHRADDGESGQRTGIESARRGFGAVGVSRRERPARAIHRVFRRPLRVEVALRGQLAEEPPQRDLGPGSEPSREDELRGRRPAREVVFEAELVDQPENRFVGEPVEVLVAEDELAREESPDRRIGDALEQRVDVFGAGGHERILALRDRADSVHWIVLMKLISMLAALALGVAAASAPALLAATAAPAPPPGRVVILGFDGVDATLVEQMLTAGRLPALSALRERGGYSPLTPTVPAQTPVSWATFSTGLDPGGHEIFDFLKRDPANLIPTFAVAEEKSVPLPLREEEPRDLRGRRGGAVSAACALPLRPPPPRCRRDPRPARPRRRHGARSWRLARGCRRRGPGSRTTAAGPSSGPSPPRVPQR